MTTTEKYTTIAAWPLAICRALEAQGINPAPLLKEVGLDHEVLCQKPDDRVDISKMTRLWQSMEQATGDCAFGLKVANFVQPMHFRALGLLMLSSSNIETAISKMEQYHSLVSNSVNIRIEYQSHLIGFAIDLIPNVEISELAIDSFFASILRLTQPSHEKSALIEKVELLRRAPKNTKPWTDCFYAPVQFNAQQNCLWLRRDLLRQASIMGDQKLATFNETVVQEYVQRLNSNSWSEKVYQVILQQLDKSEPSLTSVATQLEVGERTLRRYLLEEQNNFRQLLKNGRMEMANHYLQQPSLTITDIALRLSFTNASNFSRAFQRHYGISPSQYRQHPAK